MSPRSLLSSAGRVCVWLAIVVPAQSLLWAAVPLPSKLLAIALAVLTLWRPAVAVLVLAASLPFADFAAVRIWPVPTFRFSEALVLALLAVALFPGRRRTTPPFPDSLAGAGVALAVVIIATCAVQFALERAWQDHWPAFVLKFLRYVSVDYLIAATDPRPSVQGMAFLPAAALLLEGLLLTLVVRRYCRQDAALLPRLIRVMVVAAGVAAVVSWQRIVAAAQHAGDSVVAVAADVRMSAVIPSLGVSGAFFTMLAILAAGWALHRGARRGIGWWVLALLLGSAAWLTKTRSGIIVLVAVISGLLVWRFFNSQRLLVAMSAVLAIVAIIPVVVLSAGVLIRPQPGEAMHLRRVLAEGSVRMIAAYPIFGVGLQQFRLRYHEFRTDDMPTYIEDDPHNQFLGVATELGLLGAGLFLWFLAAGLMPAVRLLLEKPEHLLMAGLVAALTGFLLTWLSTQPLSVAAAAFSFWVLLGAAASATGAAGVRSARAGRAVPVLVGVIAVTAAASVPLRASAAIEGVDFTRVQYGFHDWEIDGAGTRYRWSSGHSTMFLPASMRVIDLPIAASFAAAERTVVAIAVDGEPAGRLELTDEAWHPIRLTAPTTARSTWRIDLHVTPAWIPSRLGRNPDDSRTLGVRVGEPEPR